jgi:hypothetical protein
VPADLGRAPRSARKDLQIAYDGPVTRAWRWQTVAAVELFASALIACTAPRAPEITFASPPQTVVSWAVRSRATDGVRVEERGELGRGGVLILRTTASWSSGGEGGAGSNETETRFQVRPDDARSVLELLDGQDECRLELNPEDPDAEPAIVGTALRAGESEQTALACRQSGPLRTLLRSLIDRAHGCVESEPPQPDCEHRWVGPPLL